LNFKRDGNAQTKSIAVPKESSYIKKQVATMKEKERNNVQPKHKWEITFFTHQGLGYHTLECPHKRIIILRDDEEVESVSHES
jgi:hypothetical protein